MSNNWADQTEEDESPVGSLDTKKSGWQGWAAVPSSKAAAPTAEPVWPENKPAPRGNDDLKNLPTGPNRNRDENAGRKDESYGGRDSGRGGYGDRGGDRGGDRYDNRDRRGGDYEDRGSQGGRDYPPRGRGGYSGDRGGYNDREPRSYNNHDDREDRGPREGGFERRNRDEGRPFERREREPREQSRREPTPLPTSPPYTIYIGNLSFDVREDDIRDFFGAKVKGVRLPVDRETARLKGFGYVEFEDLEALKSALELNNQELLQRVIKIDVATSEKGSGARDNQWGSNRPPRESAPAQQESERAERVPLNLSKRTLPVEEAAPAKSAGAAPEKPKANPFGEAKPRDESEYQRRHAEEQAKKDQERAKEEKAEPEKPKPAEPKPVEAKPADTKNAWRQSADEKKEPREFNKSAQYRDKPNDGQKKFSKDSRPPQRDNRGPAQGGKPAPPRDAKKPAEKPAEKKPEAAPKPAVKKAAAKKQTVANSFSALSVDDVDCP